MIQRILIAFFLLHLGGTPIFAQSSDKVAVLWVDPLRSLKELTSRRGILELLDRARTSGFQAIAIGVKANNGQVLYDSKIAPRLLEWKGTRVPLDFDLLRVFLDEGRSRQLQVYALYPVFAEGQMLERKGTVYREHSDWQSTVYVVENQKPEVMPITQWAHGPIAYANPLNRTVQNYEISVVEEFVKEYNFDGIILDKMRFSGIESDFSDQSRRGFEAYLGSKKADWWPEDVFEWQYVNDAWEAVPGRLFNKWVEYRAKSIQSFLTTLTARIKRVDSTLPIGNFVGSWYPTYYEYGVNWASRGHVPEDDWATESYNTTTIADKVDYSVVGCFFPRLAIQDAENAGADWWMSVEGGASLAMELVDRDSPVYGAILAAQFGKNPKDFQGALRIVLSQTTGLYVGDASYIQKYALWDEIAAVLLGSSQRAKRTLLSE